MIFATYSNVNPNNAINHRGLIVKKFKSAEVPKNKEFHE